MSQITVRKIISYSAGIFDEYKEYRKIPSDYTGVVDERRRTPDIVDDRSNKLDFTIPIVIRITDD